MAKRINYLEEAPPEYATKYFSMSLLFFLVLNNATLTFLTSKSLQHSLITMVLD